GRRGLQPLRPGGGADLPLLPRHPGAGARGRGEPGGGPAAAVAALRPLLPRARADPPHRRADHEHGGAEPAREIKAVATTTRLSKTASDFGGQLDSLCDAISFGAAPAFLLLRLGQDWQQHPQHPLVAKAVAVVAALYMACAVLRLARFNIENAPDPAAHKRFK